MKLTLLSAMLMTAVVGITSANAADYKKNPFTLVYDGAITENVAGKVNIHPVKYDLHGIQIAANVYTPANYDPAKKYPAIVVAHPNGALKSRSPVCMRSALLSMAILLLPPMQLIRGLAVGCHVTWINLRIVLKISTVWLILENPRTPKHIQKREGYSAIKALAAVNNASIQLMVYGVPSLNRG